jgi:hypothetical protein
LHFCQDKISWWVVQERPGGPEDLLFCSKFGGPVALAARAAWLKTIVCAILPPNLRSLRNYLMAPMFMCTYPKSEKKFCDNLGGIDPKTMHKWINPYVDALFELNFEVASCNLMNSFFVYMNLTNLDVKRFVGVIDLKATQAMIASCL